jgi:parallel beta-helix repeat protein
MGSDTDDTIMQPVHELTPTRYDSVSSDMEITTHVNWTGTSPLAHNYTIKNGGILNISSCNLHYSMMGLTEGLVWIEVESGGTLIINNSRIYPHWPGLDVICYIRYQDGSDGNITGSTLEEIKYVDIWSTESSGNKFSHDILIYNNTFYDWDEYAISATFADKINITDNDFCNPDDDGERTISLAVSRNATIHGNRFHDYGIQNQTGGSSFDRGIIAILSSSGNATITSNTFENLGDDNRQDIYCIKAWASDLIIDENTFRNIKGHGVSLWQNANATISNNYFENIHQADTDEDYLGLPKGGWAIFIPWDVSATIEHNFIKNATGAGICAPAGYNSTIRYNLIGECGKTGILLGEVDFAGGPSGESNNYSLYGNMLISNPIGIEIASRSDNHTIFQNSFIVNDVDVIDNNHTHNTWDNGTHGNLWYPSYTGGDMDGDWFGDSPYTAGDLTDNHPVYKVGDLPPKSGMWTINNPQAYWLNRVNVSSSISISGTASALAILSTNLNNTDNPTSLQLSNYSIFLSIGSTISRGLDIDSEGSVIMMGNEISKGDLKLNPHFKLMNFEDIIITEGDLDLSNTANQTFDGCSINGSLKVHYPDTNLIFNEFNVSGINLDSGVSYLTFNNCNFTGPFSPLSNDHLTFDTCLFDHVRINVQHSDYFAIASSTFDGYWGTYLFQAYYCHYLYFYNNTIQNTDNGFQLDECHYATIDLNDFFMNGGRAIYLYDAGTACKNVTISNNEIAGCTDAIYGDAPNATIISNEIHDIIGGGVGIDIDAISTTATISHNYIYDIEGHAIRCNRIINSILDNNTVSDTTDTGFYISDCHNCNITNSFVMHSETNGLEISSTCSDCTIYYCTFAYNELYGLRHYGDDCTIYFNSFYENGDSNIYISTGAANTQLDNGTHGNFWGPSGPGRTEYYKGSESVVDPWIGATTYEVVSGNYDNHPMLISNMDLLIYSNIIEYPFIYNEHVIVLNTTLHLQQGIDIWSGGNVTFVGTRLIFETGGAYVSPIIIEDGAEIRAIGGTLFTADQTINTYEFGLRTGSSLVLRNVRIERCGYGTFFQGIMINVTSVVLENITCVDTRFGLRIHNVPVNIDGYYAYGNEYGIYMQASSYSNISNVYVDSAQYGIILVSSSGIDVYECSLNQVDIGVTVYYTDNCVIRNSEYTGCTSNGLMLVEADSNEIIYGKFSDVPIGVNMSDGADNNKVYLNFFSGENTYILNTGTNNAIHNGTYGNMYWEYPGVDMDGDLIGDTSYNVGGLTDLYPLMVWGSFPSDNPGWEVTVDTYVLATNYTIQGEVTVYSEATFYIKGAMLWLNSTVDRERHMTINDGAHYHQQDGWLKAIDISKRFEFDAKTYSYLYVNGTLIDGCFWFATRTNHTTLYNLTLWNVFDGLYLWGQSNERICDLTISHCTVDGAAHYAIRAEYCTNLHIDDWIISDVDEGIHLVDCPNTTLSNLNINIAQYGVRAPSSYSGKLTITDSTLYFVTYGVYVWGDDSTATVLIEDVTFDGIASWGVHVRNLANITMDLCEFYPDTGGMCKFDFQTAWFEVRDCYGYDGSTAFELYHAEGVIMSSEIRNFTTGIQPWSGFTYSGFDVNITDNLFYRCESGIIPCCNGMRVNANRFHHCDKAVKDIEVDDFVFRNNTVWDCNYGIYLDGGNDRLYIEGNDYSVVEIVIYLSNGGHNTTIANETMDYCYTGISLSQVENVTISDCDITEFYYGFDLDRSTNITLQGIYLYNGSHAVYINQCSKIKMRDCDINEAENNLEFDGIFSTEYANHDIDTSNTIEGKPIYYFYNEVGTEHSSFETHHITLAYCSHVSLADFILFASDGMKIIYSDNFTIANSTIRTDITFDRSDDGLLIGNTFNSSNTITLDTGYFCTNITLKINSFLTSYNFWDYNEIVKLNGTEYGNYWYDYSGIDENEDGIGDTPHSVYAGPTLWDKLPLMFRPEGLIIDVWSVNPLHNDLLVDVIAVEVSSDITTGFYYTGPTSGTIEVTLNGTPIGTGSTPTIQFDLDTTEYEDGLYEFIMTVTVGTEVDNEKIYVRIDNTGPTLTQITIEDGFVTDTSIVFGAHALEEFATVTWTALLVNDSLPAPEANETDGTHEHDFSYEYTPLADGVYNLTLVSEDSLGNLNSVSILIIFDTSDPEMDSPDDISYVLGDTDNVITWIANDLTPNHYNVSIDGEFETKEDWTGGAIEVNVDGLDVGTHTVEILVCDELLHFSTDTVIVTVTEITAPTIDSPSDIEYSEGSTGHNITWTPSDSYPDYYIIYRNDSIIDDDEWDGSEIVVSIDGLSYGVYNYTIFVNDTSGNSAVDTVIVTVLDLTSPTIDHPDDKEIAYGATGLSLTWNPSDLHPASYEILRNGTSVKSGLWNSTDESISMSLDGLEAGVFNFTIIVFDTFS